MRQILFLLALQSTVAFADPAITIHAENRTGKGWMREGWGGYRFTIKNDSGQAATILRWLIRWESATVDWGGDLNQALPAGETVTRDEIGNLTSDIIERSKPHLPTMVGSFTIKIGDKTVDVPFRLEIPEAVLPEPLKLVKGKTAGMSLMVSRYKQFKHTDRTLRWVDQCYAAMIELTGQHPFGGKLMVFKESPTHPWWAYAGQEMILNTDYVGETLKNFDNGILAFGWIHEVGHNFDDGIGDWYIWDGPSAEFQANFKLSYAIENIPDQSFRMKWKISAPGYRTSDTEILMTGHELVERFFVLFGDPYLADPKRTFDSMSSDEIHSFFQRLQRVYGWDVFKRWYRTYRRLVDAGLKPPTTPEDKVNLIAAILNFETKNDLVPAFQRWRFPVTAEKVKAMGEKYKIGQ
jgi:hypothetical protein